MAILKLKGINLEYNITEAEAQKLNEIFLNDRVAGSEVMKIGPISFRKSEIKLIQIDEVRALTGLIDLSDPAQRTEIEQFEKDFLAFIATQSKEKQTFDHWLINLGIIGFAKPSRIVQSGLEGFDQGSMLIYKPQTYGEYSKKWSAYNYMGWYREKKSLVIPEKETLFEMSDEINVKDIPF